MSLRRQALAAVTVTGLLLLSAACSSDGEGPQGGPSSSQPNAGGTSTSSLSGEITVFAAASLRKTFTEIGAQFERTHPGTKVSFNFAGSSDLAAQILQGAPADVFASADTKNMGKVTAESLTTAAPATFASNTLEIVTHRYNPAEVSGLQDLVRPGVKVVVCAPEVPCGAAAVTVEKAAGLDIKPVSEEQSVTDVMGKVLSGEADAGLVYVTDVKAAGRAVQGLPFPEAPLATNTYPIAALKASKNSALAEAFVKAVTGEPGQRILADAGFAKAP